MNNTNAKALFACVALVFLGGIGGGAYYFWFKDRVADNAKTPPATRAPADLKVPIIFWGGDVATFHANGGLRTEKNTLFARHGLDIELVRHPGDDFTKQVDAYVKGESPFLRGTMSMLGQVADKLGRDPKTRPVVFLQMTWSAGDHLVARSNLRTLADLKGKKIALQKGGPHVGMLHDILRTAQLSRDDVDVKWVEAVAGDNGPAARFRKDPAIDACFVISPEMTELTGGLDKKSPAGDHVLVSTAHMMRSIADVYACRKDFYDQHRDKVEKFTAAYLKACEELLALKGKKAGYDRVLQLTQDIYGKEEIKSLDDAAGLIDDATFVGLPGNIHFFTNRGNLSGFEVKQKAALDTAFREQDISEKIEFHKAGFDYAHIRRLGDLTSKERQKERFHRIKALPKGEEIFSFTISFEPDKDDFPFEQYGRDFQRALDMASLFGNAVVVVRGHGDPSAMLTAFAKEAVEHKVLREVYAGNERRFYLTRTGAEVKIGDLKQVIDVIERESKLDKKLANSIWFVEALQELSEKRVGKAQERMGEFARSKGFDFDPSQFRTQGVGAREPRVARLDASEAEKATNRRVEFRLVRIDEPNTVVPEWDVDR